MKEKCYHLEGSGWKLQSCKYDFIYYLFISNEACLSSAGYEAYLGA